MNTKKCLAMLLALCMALALCACNADEGSEPSTPAEPPASMDPGAQQTDPGDANPDVSFDLQEPPAPDFDSPATGDDSGKIYTIEGDYAYEMDPATLKPIGPPLDPITKEPVNNPVLDGTNPSTPNNPQYSNPTASEPPAESNPPVQSDPPVTTTEPPTTPPSDENKLPNTGMFLEDD